MPKTNTDPKLLEALANAAGRAMTPDQVREQRISFVMSAVGDGSAVTRSEVELIIDQREGCAA